MSRRGLFVALEGSDGSGKTTLLQGLQERFNQHHIPVIVTREPGGTELGEEIRSLLLDLQYRGMDERCEALLYAAARAQHVHSVLRPALEAGKCVLCDRYILSSIAYQGKGRGLGMDAIERLNLFATREFMPDVTLFLDVDPLTVLQRKALVQAQDRLEEAGDAFHQAVYEGYQEGLSYFEPVERIDASRSKSEVVEEAWQILQKYWEQRS